MEGAELLKFRCTGCGECCKLHAVVTDADVARLMAGTGLPAAKLVKFFTPKEMLGSSRGQGWIKFGPGGRDRRMMGLRKRPGGDQGCMFLGKDDRCGVYEHRPVTCRVYPFNLDFDDDLRKVTKIEINDACECPYELDGRESLPNIKRNYFWDDEQDDVYFAKVRRWNRRRKYGTQKEFLACLGLDGDPEEMPEWKSEPEESLAAIEA